MPIVQQDTTGYEQKKKDQQQGMTLGGQDVNVSGNSQSQIAPSAQPQQQGSGTFTDINKYQKANEQAAGSLSTGLQQGFNKDVNKVSQAIQSNTSELNKQIANNRASIEARKKAALGIVNQSSGLTQGQQPLDNKAINTYKNFATGKEGYTTQQYNDIAQKQKSDTLQTQARDLSRANVRRDLLRKQFGSGRNKYTSGQSALDQSILNKNKQAVGDLISSSRNSARSLSENIKNTGNTNRAEIARVNNEQIQARNEISQARATAEDNLRNKIVSEQQRYRDILSGLSTQGGLANPNDLIQGYKDLGVTDAQINQFRDANGNFQNYGINAADNFKSANDITLSDVATQDQAAQAQALANLAGQDTSSIVSDPNAVNSLNPSSIIDAINANKAEYDASVNNQNDIYNRGMDVARSKHSIFSVLNLGSERKKLEQARTNALNALKDKYNLNPRTSGTIV